MNIKILTGPERDRQIVMAGCCMRCGFREPLLVAWKDAERKGVHCEECIAHEPGYKAEGARAIYLPEMSVEAFANYVRVLSWASFAARAELLRGHDFTAGTLPVCFAEPSTWNKEVRWKTLAQGIADVSTHAIIKDDLKKVAEASKFLLERLEYTERRYPIHHPVVPREDDNFQRDFKVLRPGISMRRVRAWGAPGSTFFMLASKGAASTRSVRVDAHQQ
jgi:hypothetical protein